MHTCMVMMVVDRRTRSVLIHWALMGPTPVSMAFPSAVEFVDEEVAFDPSEGVSLDPVLGALLLFVGF